MKQKEKLVLFSILVVLAVIAVIAVPSALADIPPSKAYPANATWFDPENTNATYCNTVDVDVWMNTTVAVTGFRANFTYTQCCANVTEVVYCNTTNWDAACRATLGPGYVILLGRSTKDPGIPAGLIHWGTLKIHCCNDTAECLTNLAWNLADPVGIYIEGPRPDMLELTPVTWHDGTFTCESEEKPDLVVEKSVTIADGNFSVSYTVTNNGSVPAGESTTCKYLDGVLMESQPCPALGPGESHGGAFLSEPCPCGATLNVTVCADNDKEVNESDETNNCEVNFVDCPYIEVDIRADGIANNIFDVTGYMICPGTVTEDGLTINNETAMGALVIYCQNNGINIHITLGTWGEYVVQIGNDLADNNSWSYAVNEVVPPVGGAQKVIVDGDRVHWYNNNLHYYEVLTALDKTAIYVDETLTATVTWKDIAGTDFLNGASVHVGAMGPWGPDPGPSVGTTGLEGTCTFPWSTVGTWGVYAVDPVHGSGIYNYPPVTFTCSAEEKPDLVVEKKWELWVEEAVRRYNVSYVIFNNGTAIAPRGHNTTLYVDGVEIEHKQIPVDLAPGDNYTDTFDTVVERTGNFDTIKVCVDNDNVVDELNETNNCLENVWPPHCPAEIAVYQADVPNADGILNALRTERDNNLKDVYVGRYYDYSTELTMVMTKDPALAYEAARLLVKYLPMIQQQVTGTGKVKLITGRDVEEVVSFTDGLKRSVLKNRGEIGATRSQEIIKFMDEFKEQVEASEGKTFSEALKSSIYCESEPMPDLEITDIWNNGNKIYYKIKNIGTEAAGSSRTSLTVDGTMKRYDTVKPLGAGAERTEIFSYIFSYKWTCTGTSDEIKVCADYRDAVTESNEGNNCKTETWECPEIELPDLVITDIWHEGNKIYYKIKNNGPAKAGSSRTSLTVDGDYKKYDSVRSLGAGEERTESFRYGWTCAGTSDEIEVCADYRDAVAESNEGNNCRTVIWECDIRS